MKNVRRTRIKGEITFKSLSRKRYRCNQTGKIVKNCAGHRRMIANKGKKFHNRIPEAAKDLPQVELSLGTWECPYHHPWYIPQSRINYSDKSGIIDVCICGKQVWIIRK